MRLPVLLLALLSSSGAWAQAQEQDLLLDCIGVREVYVNTALTERKDARQTYALRDSRLIFEAPAGRVREVVPTKVGQFSLTFNAPRHPMLEFSKNYYLEIDRISGEAREQYQDASGTCGRAETFCETKFVGICKKVTQRF